MIFYFAYTVTPGGEVIDHELECDSNAPATLVISQARAEGAQFVSIILGGDDKREWFALSIVHLKFGLQR